MIKYHSRIVFLFIIFCITLFFVAETTGQNKPQAIDIKGYIKDIKSGEALPFATIAIKGTKLGTSSNANGYFVLVNIPYDTCTLVINYIGYKSQSVKLNNIQKGLLPLDIKMSPATIELEGVTITADAMMLSTAEHISQISVSPSQLSTLPSIGEVDIFRSLQLLPGINAGSNGSSELYIRGGTPDQNLVILDGMTIYHVDHFFGFFSAFNADAVKDIQVYKGGFPAEYGGRISSVLNLTGKSGDENKTQFGLGLNLLSAHMNFETPLPLFEKSTFLFTFRRSYTDFIKSPLYSNIFQSLTGQASGVGGGGMGRKGGGKGNFLSTQLVPDFYFYDLNSKLTVSPTSDDIVKLSFYNGKDNLDQSQNFESTNFRVKSQEMNNANLNIQDYTKWGNLGFSSSWSRQWHDRFQTEISAAHSTYTSDYNRGSSLNTNFAPSSDSISFKRGFSTATKESNNVVDMTYRFDANWHIAQAHQFDFGLWISNFNSNYNSSLNDTTQLLHRSNSSALNALYIQDKWNINDFELSLGLRTTNYQLTQKLYYEPRFSLSYSLTNEVKLKGAWGNYYQFVNRISNENVLEGSRDFWLLADENLKPSFAEHEIIGINYENPEYLLSIEAYNKNLDNLLQYSRRFNGIADYQNSFFFGKGTAKGLEFLLQKKSGNLSGWIGYTLAKVEYAFPKMNDGNPFPADQDHRHDLKIVGKYIWGDWIFASTWVYATGNAYTAPESQYFIKLLNGESYSYIHISGKNANRLPDFHQLDLSVSTKFDFDPFNAEAGLSIFNVYNHSNVSYRQYNLNTTPITVTDVVQLGIMPSIFIQLNLK